MYTVATVNNIFMNMLSWSRNLFPL